MSLLNDLRSISADGYSEYERIVLNYALQLAEMIAGGERRTRMSMEEWEKLPDALEFSDGFVEPKHWTAYRDLRRS